MFESEVADTHEINCLAEALGALATGVHCGDDDDE